MLKDGTPEDYSGAAIRHFSDATMLSAANKYDNAGHLIGFAAECAIKFRVEIQTSESLVSHLPELLAPARKRLGSRANFSTMYSILKEDVLKGWAIDFRYAPTGKVTSPMYAQWESTTKRLMAAAGIKVRQP